jgi:dihydrofolate reductase
MQEVSGARTAPLALRGNGIRSRLGIDFLGACRTPTDSDSRTPLRCTRIAAGDLAEAITRLKQERSDGYLLAHGGARFARSLVETGLIDEYRLVIHPVVLGAGERIFLAPLTIEPVSTTVFSGGAVAHVFAAHR